MSQEDESDLLQLVTVNIFSCLGGNLLIINMRIMWIPRENAGQIYDNLFARIL
jgi:hypothetical protein